jgi:hypothetical protein
VIITLCASLSVIRNSAINTATTNSRGEVVVVENDLVEARALDFGFDLCPRLDDDIAHFGLPLMKHFRAESPTAEP